WPWTTRRPSQTPSPSTKPLSKTDTVASARGSSRPLIQMRMSALRGSSWKSWMLWAMRLSSRKGSESSPRAAPERAKTPVFIDFRPPGAYLLRASNQRQGGSGKPASSVRHEHYHAQLGHLPGFASARAPGALFCCPQPAPPQPHPRQTPARPMINITLPDGSQRSFDHPVSVADVAASIGPGLAKATLAGKVDGKLVDASYRIERDASLEIVTDKSPEALDLLRHSTAHLLAQAVQRLYPGAQVTIGPVIEDGFYYDFAYDRPFTPEDLPAIEAEMHKIVKEALPVSRSVKSRDEAVAF